jgi:hypothetical protein
MRIPVLVLNTRTRNYLKKDGQWTSSCCEAAVFLSTHTAIEFCLQQQVRDAELIVRFEKLNHDVSVPLILGGAAETACAGT